MNIPNCIHSRRWFSNGRHLKRLLQRPNAAWQEKVEGATKAVTCCVAANRRKDNKVLIVVDMMIPLSVLSTTVPTTLSRKVNFRRSGVELCEIGIHQNFFLRRQTPSSSSDADAQPAGDGDLFERFLARRFDKRTLMGPFDVWLWRTLSGKTWSER